MTIRPWADIRELDRLWAQSALGDQPLGAELRRGQGRWWTRFYTLPGGERIARTDAERAEQRHRYLAVLEALGTPAIVTTVGRTPELDAAAPATRWRTVPGDVELTVYASAVDSAHDLVPLLDVVAADRAHDVIVGPADLRWLMHPYDGGMDVISLSPFERFAQWRSPRADGL